MNALSDDPSSDADAGVETFEAEMDLTLRQNTLDLLAEIDTALAHLDDGTYGICEHCGKPIPRARLAAIPYANRCVPCGFER